MAYVFVPSKEDDKDGLLGFQFMVRMAGQDNREVHHKDR